MKLSDIKGDRVFDVIADLIDPAILSTIQGVSAEEYRAGLNLGVLLRDCLELLNDPQFSELFPSAQTEMQPGSAQANTEALPL